MDNTTRFLSVAGLLLATLSLEAADNIVTNGGTLARTKSVQTIMTPNGAAMISLAAPGTNVLLSWEVWNVGTNSIAVTNGVANGAPLVTQGMGMILRAVTSTVWSLPFPPAVVEADPIWASESGAVARVNQLAGYAPYYATNNIAAMDMWMYDQSSVFSIKWGDRQLLDASGFCSILWANREAYGSDGYPTINWANHTLQEHHTTDQHTSLDWASRQMWSREYDALAINWENRKLYGADGQEVLAWSSGVATTNIIYQGTNVAWKTTQVLALDGTTNTIRYLGTD